MQRTVARACGIGLLLAWIDGGFARQVPPQDTEAHAPFQEPGPLAAGPNGDIYLGPGFGFSMPPNWTVALDDAALGRGERGTARGPVQNNPDADASIRFEPFPDDPGSATLARFESHIRGTLAAGVPVAVQPLIYRGSDPFLETDQAEGVAIHFTRPGEGGNAPRRYFVYACPRRDGRLQTLICSHSGP